MAALINYVTEYTLQLRRCKLLGLTGGGGGGGGGGGSSSSSSSSSE